MKMVKWNAEAQRRFWEQNPQVLQPAIYFIQSPDFSYQIELESTMISPESWKTPAEHDKVISGSSLEHGSRDSELSWVETAFEDGSKVASWVRSESRYPDLAKISCAEAVARRMSWEGFLDLEEIGIKDPPGVD